MLTRFLFLHRQRRKYRFPRSLLVLPTLSPFLSTGINLGTIAQLVCFEWLSPLGWTQRTVSTGFALFLLALSTLSPPLYRYQLGHKTQLLCFGWLSPLGWTQRTVSTGFALFLLVLFTLSPFLSTGINLGTIAQLVCFE